MPRLDLCLARNTVVRIHNKLETWFWSGATNGFHEVDFGIVLSSCRREVFVLMFVCSDNVVRDFQSHSFRAAGSGMVVV